MGGGVREGRGGSGSRGARPPSRSGGSRESREGQPGGRWAQPPPLKGPRRPRWPRPPGPAQRPGREAVAPGRAAGRGAGPCRPSLRPRLPITWRPARRDAPDASTRKWPFGASGPSHPPSGPSRWPELPAPPQAPAPREGGAVAALGPGLRATTPPPSFSSDVHLPFPPELPPNPPALVFTGTRGGGDSSVPRLRWQPVPSPDHRD